MAFLVWENEGKSVSQALESDILIGRSPGNDIVLADKLVSGFHARIIFQDGAWVFEDLGSTNGSFTNEALQERATLKHGDFIRIGHTRFAFRSTLDEDTQEPPLLADKEFLNLRRGYDVNRADGGIAGKIEDFFQDESGISPVTTVFSTRAQFPPSGRGQVEDAAVLDRRLHACYEISRATVGTLSMAETMDKILMALFEIFRHAERAFILLVDPGTQRVKSLAVKRRVPEDTDRISISRTVLNQAMKNKEAVLCKDALTDERFAEAQSIISLGIRSLMVAPLVFQDEVLGAIHVDTCHGSGEFVEDDLNLLSVAAAQVAGSVANAHMHEKVVAAERLTAVGQTVAGLAHCIKNIIQGIKGGAYIVDMALGQNKLEQLPKGWEMVKRNNVFMEELVFDLLSYSKERQPEIKTINLNDLCSEICELCSARAKEKQVAVRFTPDPSVGLLSVDPKGIRRCLLNLMMNGIDACAEGKGTVAMETRSASTDGFVSILVKDTGCGMSDETREKLFTVFFSTKGSRGTGLGLPVTRKIIEEHGGHIHVESQEGHGTTFTILVPAERPDGS